MPPLCFLSLCYAVLLLSLVVFTSLSMRCAEHPGSRADWDKSGAESIDKLIASTFEIAEKVYVSQSMQAV